MRPAVYETAAVRNYLSLLSHIGMKWWVATDSHRVLAG
jgi:hypothetical protein